jgi:hypothetical protein
MIEHDGGKDIYLRVHPPHNVVHKNSSAGVNGLPLRFYFFIRKEAWLRENQRIVDVSGSLKRSKVWCRLADFPLEFLSWATEDLYQAIVVGRTSNYVLDRADKGTYQFHYLDHWLRGRWIWEIRDIIVQLLEQPVELVLELWEPTKQLKSTPKV